MIDRSARNELALSLRLLGSGQLTNDEFDTAAYAEFLHRTDDQALAELSVFGWLHYNDLWPYRLRGRHALSRGERRQVARCVLFLKSNNLYTFDDAVRRGTRSNEGGRCILLAIALMALVPGVALFLHGSRWLGVQIILAQFAFIHWLRTFRFALGRRSAAPPVVAFPDTFWPFADEHAADPAYAFWPFASRRSYEAALAHPPYLCGSRARVVE